MSAVYGTAEDDDLLVAIVLEGVTQPAMRKMLEHVVREGDLQRACILKGILLPCQDKAPQQ
jgi:hypothetical protein